MMQELDGGGYRKKQPLNEVFKKNRDQGGLLQKYFQ
jgi:hypothetical protein